MQRGFSLIEMLIVTAIIGILASVAVPSYQDYIARAQVSEALVFATRYRTDASLYFAETGDFMPEVQRLEYTGNFVDNCGCTAPTIYADGTVMIIFGRNASKLLAHRAVILKPFVKDGNIEWHCGGARYFGGEYYSVSDQKYMPGSCRDLDIGM